MAITYFGSASTPTDNGTSTGTPIAVTPPGSMVTGDLVVMYGYYRGTSTITVSAAGGQFWFTMVPSATATNLTLSYAAFYCRYNGTWGTNPSLAFSTSSTNCNVIMHVFRPTAGANTWSSYGRALSPVRDNTAPGSPFTCTSTFLPVATEFASNSLFSDGSLAAYWKLEDVNSTVGSFTLTDSSNGFTSGIFGNAVQISNAINTTNRLDMSGGLGINMANACSICFWAKVEIPMVGVTDRVQRFVDWRSTTTTNRYLILDYVNTSSGLLKKVTLDASGNVVDFQVELDDNWNHYCVTYPATGTARVYINGTQVSTVTKGSTTGGSANFTIGNTPAGSPTYPFTGLIDDMAVFTRELTAAEVLTLAGYPPLSASTRLTSSVQVGAFITDDDNTWGTLAGTGFVVTGGAQYRNTSGSDSSSTFAHKINSITGPSSTSSFTKNQATNGGDPYISIPLIFYEEGTIDAGRTPKPTSIGHPFIF